MTGTSIRLYQMRQPSGFGGQAVTITWLPATVTSASGNGLVAGPVCTLPSSIENWLPWHWQLILPPSIWVTGQLWWVQILLKALNFPRVGCVIT